MKFEIRHGAKQAAHYAGMVWEGEERNLQMPSNDNSRSFLLAYLGPHLLILGSICQNSIWLAYMYWLRQPCLQLRPHSRTIMAQM